jgi:glutaredoxin
MAKDLIYLYNQNYREYNVESGSSKWILSLLKKAGYKTVPQIYAPDGKHIGGYEALIEYLKENHVGYD